MLTGRKEIPMGPIGILFTKQNELTGHWLIRRSHDNIKRTYSDRNQISLKIVFRASSCCEKAKH